MAGIAASGDTTFAIDEIAEDAIVSFIEANGLNIAYYSEDKGLIEFGENPEGVLIIDPIDGTRPAMAGFEQCVVSVAWANYKQNATLGDVRCGCIAELKQDDLFIAERGAGVLWIGADGQPKPIRRLPITEISKAPVTFEVVARPIRYIAETLADVIDPCSLNGGCFTVSSTAFSLTRLITGNLAAALDVGARIYFEVERAQQEFEKLGGGRMIGLFTYDIAAAALIAEEGGAIVTNAAGKSLRDMPLLDTSPYNVQSLCAASTPELHAALLFAIENGIQRLQAL
jgi:myo-inositol-1(or 4)-monophosphatase